MSKMTRIPVEYAAVIAEKSAKRGITFAEGLRQVLALGLPSWRDRGASERKKRLRAAQKAFKTVLVVGMTVCDPDGREFVLERRRGEKHWDGRYPDGMALTIPEKFIKPVQS